MQRKRCRAGGPAVVLAVSLIGRGRTTALLHTTGVRASLAPHGDGLHRSVYHRHTKLHSASSPAKLSEAQTDIQLPNSVLSLSLDTLSAKLGGVGRARMVWALLSNGEDPLNEANLGDRVTSKTFEELNKRFRPFTWKVVSESVAPCGTVKLLLQLEDGLLVESVVIPSLTGKRSTVCVSSQVGCARACTFCMTGKMGLVRNLSTEEILAQVYLARRTVGQRGLPPLQNVVFMGMGEPMNNVRAVEGALHSMTHHHMFGIGRRHISVSTVGPSPLAIRAMVHLPASLAWSVHAADDEVRKALVPTTAHTMVELRDAFSWVLHQRKNDHLFVEVTLIEDVNDTPELALKLVELLRPLPGKTKVNLLPYNDTGHPTYRTSSMARVRAFQTILVENGLMSTVRITRGLTEGAACGQLATSAKF